MNEELKRKIFHWVERALARLGLIGDKGEFNRHFFFFIKKKTCAKRKNNGKGNKK